MSIEERTALIPVKYGQHFGNLGEPKTIILLSMEKCIHLA